MTKNNYIILILVIISFCSISRYKRTDFDFDNLSRLVDSISKISAFDSLETIILYKNAEKLNFRNNYQLFLSESDTISKYSDINKYNDYLAGVELLNIELTQYKYIINNLRKGEILIYRKYNDLHLFTIWKFIDNEDGYIFNKAGVDLKNSSTYFNSGKQKIKKLNDYWYKFSIK